MLTLLLLSATMAAPPEPPKFVVENHIPKRFEVENLIPPKKTETKKTLCGCGFSGKCECWKGECACSACGLGGAAQKTFRSGDYNATHRCPECGRQSPGGTGTWIVRGNGPRAGTHVHQCDNPKCGASWWH